MTTTAPTIDQTVIRSIQTVLTEFGESVRGGLTDLRNEIGAERNDRALLEDNLKMLAEAVQRSQSGAGSTSSDADLAAVLEVVQGRLDAIETKADRGRQDISDRLDRMVGEQHNTISTAVTSSVSEINRSLSDRQQVIESAVERLHERLNNFDVQAARMVEYFSEMTGELTKRIDERPEPVQQSAGETVSADQIEQLRALGEENSAEMRKSVSEKIDAAMSEMNERFLAAQSMAGEGTNQSLADIDAYVGRVSSSLDEAISMLSDRIAHLDRRLEELDVRVSVPSPPAAPAVVAHAAAPAVVFVSDNGVSQGTELFTM
jgi:DNA anti-recombination protein RmuC